MSELINRVKEQKYFRWQLLTTVSAASLLAALSSPDSAALAQDTDRPTVWLELGGQLEALQNREEPYAAPFVINNLDKPVNAVPLTSRQTPPHHAFGGEGSITFQPADADWVFSAAVRYGRSNSKGKLHQQTSTQFFVKTLKYNPTAPKFAEQHATRFNDTTVKYSTSHAIMDFTAGKDVGLGMIGDGGSSTLNLGVRIAQFQKNSNVNFRSYPDPYFKSKAIGQFTNFVLSGNHHHSYYARAHIDRNFRGIGPSISWEGTAPILGHQEDGEVTFDWGANAAALFGRQRVQGYHKTTSLYFLGNVGNPTQRRLTVEYDNIRLNRSRSVVVPNLGGFAGISMRYPNVKLSLGYHADFFFGAMDNGVDTHNSTSQGFYGPFANISIGLGD